MQRIPSTSAKLVSVLAVALILRLVAGFWWQARLPDGQRFVFGDSESYFVLAQAIAGGEPYEYGEGMRVFRAPGYPTLLASLFLLVGDDLPVMWARALSAVLGTLTVGGVIWIARQLFDTETAFIAGALAAVYPGAIGVSTFVLSEAPFCPLMLLQFVVWIAAIREPSVGRQTRLAALGGIIAGCATLVRPSWLTFTPCVALLIAVTRRDHRRQAWLGLVMTLALAASMLPWWIRNYRITGKFVLTTLQVGASLYDGLNPRATGASDFWFDSRFRRAQQECDSTATGPLEGTFEYRLDQRLRQAGTAWASEHPGRAMQLAGIKFLRMWSPWPNAEDMQSWVFRSAIVVGYTPLLVLGICGAVLFRRAGWNCFLCLMPTFYFTALHVVFVSSIRYREPAMLTLIVMAAGVIRGFVHGAGPPREGDGLPRADAARSR